MADKENVVDPTEYLLGGNIQVEFGPEVPIDVAAAYDIPIGDTAYVDPNEFTYPIVDEDDFYRQVLAARRIREE